MLFVHSDSGLSRLLSPLLIYHTLSSMGGGGGMCEPSTEHILPAATSRLPATNSLVPRLLPLQRCLGMRLAITTIGNPESYSFLAFIFSLIINQAACTNIVQRLKRELIITYMILFANFAKCMHKQKQ